MANGQPNALPVNYQPPVWTFTQLSSPPGGGQPKVLTLAGWSAPFGRPRNGTLFNQGLKVRYARTDYPGNNIPPTIHRFGSNAKPIEMHGRWMDRTIPGFGASQQYASDWRKMVADQVAVRMSWGALLSYQILIHDIDINVEGPGDIAWALKAEVLLDEQAPAPPATVETQAPFDIAFRMSLQVQAATPFSTASYPSLMGMLQEISDSLASLKSAINTPFQDIYNTCSALSSFQTAVSSDLTGMLSGISAMRTGLLSLRDETDYAMSSVSLLNSPDATAVAQIGSGLLNASDIIFFTSDKQTSDISINQMLALLTNLELQINLARRGKPLRAYVAQNGDTWESAAERVMGSADGARQLRSFNGIRYGQMPIPGQSYTVPG
jgi:hypothetical protein